MSYCRWSSDNYQCDVYCYEAEDGFKTHVAGARYGGDIPKLPAWGSVPEKEFLAAHRAQSEAIRNAPLIPIGLTFDGQTFADDSLGQMKATLIMLKAEGYNVPDFVFEAIDEEMTAPPAPLTAWRA